MAGAEFLKKSNISEQFRLQFLILPNDESNSDQSPSDIFVQVRLELYLIIPSDVLDFLLGFVPKNTYEGFLKPEIFFIFLYNVPDALCREPAILSSNLIF